MGVGRQQEAEISNGGLQVGADFFAVTEAKERVRLGDCEQVKCFPALDLCERDVGRGGLG